MPSPPLRFAIVGCGNVSTRHARCLTDLEETELVAACDLDANLARAFAARWKGRAFASLDLLLCDAEVDAVAVCVPTPAHAEVAEQVARAGKHLLVEKPIAGDAGRARALLETCRSRGLTLSVVSQHRFHEHARWLKRLVRSDALGRPLLGMVRSLWARDQSYYEAAAGRGLNDPSEGGVLMNQGVHYLDLLLWILGRATSVTGVQATLTHKIATEDTAALALTLASGALATVVASTSVTKPIGQELEIRFERGSVVLESGKIRAWSASQGIQINPPPCSGERDPLEPLRRQYRDVVMAARTGAPPLVTAEEALHVLEVIQAAYEAQRSGGRVLVASARAAAGGRP